MAINGAAAFFAGAFVGSALIGAGGLVIGGLIAQSSGASFWDGAADGFMIGSGIGFAVGGAWGYTHYALQKAGNMAVNINLESLVNNPLDEFVVNGPYDKAISHWTKNLAQNPHGYNTIPNLEGVIEPIRVVKGTTQIANGHHRIMVLKKLGVKTIKIFYTL